MKSVIRSIQTFFQEVGQEARKVSWPTWEETKRSTLLVVGFSAFVALLLGLFDAALRALLLKLFI